MDNAEPLPPQDEEEFDPGEFPLDDDDGVLVQHPVGDAGLDDESMDDPVHDPCVPVDEPEP
jgi:hypothetical protein